MDKCQKCGSERVARIDCKHRDMFSFSCPADDIKIDGDYAPRIKNLCGGDYTAFRVCLECGQVQGQFPVQVK